MFYIDTKQAIEKSENGGEIAQGTVTVTNASQTSNREEIERTSSLKCIRKVAVC